MQRLGYRESANQKHSAGAHKALQSRVVLHGGAVACVTTVHVPRARRKLKAELYSARAVIRVH